MPHNGPIVIFTIINYITYYFFTPAGSRAPRPGAAWNGDSMEEFDRFKELISTLRGKNGCPWDRKQTLASMAKYLREETEEAIEEIEKASDEGACEELGDVMLIVLMMAQIAEDEGRFKIEDILEGISEKIIRRHPHVFGGESVESEKEVLVNWRRIKEEEKKAKGAG